MTDILQKPFGEVQDFQKLIKEHRSLVVFLRHPG